MITGTKPPHICFSEQHIYEIHKRLRAVRWRSALIPSPQSPGPPHLQHAQLGAMGWGSLSVISHMGVSLELPGSDRLPSESYTHPLVSEGKEILAELGLGGAVCRPRQRLEQVVEETGAQSFVHPFAGEKHVVHLVHALDVACAVFLLSLQPWCEFCREREEMVSYSAPNGQCSKYRFKIQSLFWGHMLTRQSMSNMFRGVFFLPRNICFTGNF